MFKKCPFCKKEIKFNETKCPFCNRILVEKIYESSQVEHEDFNDSSFDTAKTNSSRKFLKFMLKNIFNLKKILKSTHKDNRYVYQFDKWKKYKKASLLVISIFIIIIFFHFNGQSVRNQPAPNNKEVILWPPNNIENINIKKEYHSLPNGTILNSVPFYLKGLGELKIENGTDLDAVAKLVRSYPRKSIYTVYIRAKNSYKIIGISNGTYDLYFTHGKDWDEVNGEFLVSKSYSKFKDNFEFATKNVTKNGGEYEEYSVYEVTLHPVLGGAAKTETVSENEFNKF